MDKVKLRQQRVKRLYERINKKSGVFNIVDGKRSECWMWTGGRFKDGYGHSQLGRVHRVVWELKNGKIPKGLFVLHKCDNPSCVRLSHLFLGTHQDNMGDRNRKGRQAKGSRHGSVTHPEKIRRGATHPFVLNPLLAARGNRHGSKTQPESLARGERVGGAKLTRDKIITIKRLYAKGVLTQHLIGQKFGVTGSQISNIVRGKHWNECP